MDFLYLASCCTRKAVNKDGNTPLHLAIHGDNFELALIFNQSIVSQSMFGCYALVNVLQWCNKEGKTPFDLAAGKSISSLIRIQFVEFAMEHLELSVLQQVNEENTTLHLATLEGDHDLANAFLKFYPSMLKQRNNDGNTALHLATLKGDHDLARAFLQFYPSMLEQRNNDGNTADGNTALHLATLKGNHDLANTFLQFYPSTLEQCSNDGNTALHLATLKGDHDLASTFLQFQSSTLKPRNNDGNTSLHRATLAGDYNLADVFLRFYAPPPDECNNEGNRTSHPAFSESHYNYLEKNFNLAKDFGHDAMLISDNDGNIALHLALSKGNPQLLDIFISETSYTNPQNLEICNKKGDMPLHLAIKGRQFKHAKILIELDTVVGSINKVMEISNNKDETPRALIGSAHRLPYEFEEFIWYDPKVVEAIVAFEASQVYLLR